MKNKAIKVSNLFSIKYSFFLCLLYSLFLPVLIASPLIITNYMGFSLAHSIGLNKSNIYVLLMFITSVAAVILYFLINSRLVKAKVSWSLLGIRKFELWRAFKYIACWPLIVIGILTVVALISNAFGYQPPAKNPTDDLINPSSNLLIVLAAVSLLVPILEEVLYRGILFQNLKDHKGFVYGLVISSIFFAVSHINPLQIATAIILAPYLCFMYKRLGSIVPGIILHMFHNAGVTILTIYALR